MLTHGYWQQQRRCRVQSADLQQRMHMLNTDVVAQLGCKGKKVASELRFMGRFLSDNCHGLIADVTITTADNHAAHGVAKVISGGTCRLLAIW